jgi:single-strand DNA-binding protein
MSSLNKVTLIGNLGKDPEIRKTQDGRSIANFSLAMSESWKDKNTGEKKEKTEWINVVVFSEGLVGVVEKYVHKGSKIFIEGQLQTRKWQDKDGSDRYTTEVVLQNFKSNLILLDGKNNAQPNDSGQHKPLPQAEGNFTHELDDSIPF